MFPSSIFSGSNVCPYASVEALGERTCGLGLKTSLKRTSPLLGRFLILGSAAYRFDEGHQLLG
jgi:hypothetical protein